MEHPEWVFNSLQGTKIIRRLVCGRIVRYSRATRCSTSGGNCAMLRAKQCDATDVLQEQP